MPKETLSEPVRLRVKPEELNQLKTIAERNQRTLANQCLVALRLFLAAETRIDRELTKHGDAD